MGSMRDGKFPEWLDREVREYMTRVVVSAFEAEFGERPEWLARLLRYTDDVQVQCHAGYRGEEEPRAFVRGGTRVEIAEIIDRWLDPEYRYFKVRGTDGRLYMLRHEETDHRWELYCFPPP